MNPLTLLKSIVSDISDALKSEDFLNAHRFPNRFVRNRSLSMFHVITYLLHSNKKGMHNNLSEVMEMKTIGFPNVLRQAVSKARQGINPSLFRDLFNISVDAFVQSDIQGKLWRGKERLFAIDGSRIQLPDSRSNFESFGEMRSKLNPDKPWSQALASVIYDINNDYICHGLLRPYISSERTAALDHCKALESLGILKGAVLIFDRGYYSEAMFRYFSEHGYFCVMRIKEKLKLAKSCKGDTVSSLHFSNGRSKPAVDIPVRVVSVDLGNGTTEYLATNIFDKSYTQDDFKELYFKRWNLLYELCIYTNFYGRNALLCGIHAIKGSYKTIQFSPRSFDISSSSSNQRGSFSGIVAVFCLLFRVIAPKMVRYNDPL